MGGAERQLVRLANELACRNFEIHVGVLNLENRDPTLNLKSEIKVHDLGFRFFSQPARSFLRILNFIVLLRKNGFNIMYSFMPEAIIVSFAVAKLFSYKTLRISAVRGSLVRRRGLLKKLYSYFLKDSDLVIFNSSYLATQFAVHQGLATEKIEVVFNGVDLVVPQSNTILEPPLAITISNFHSYKGHEKLIRAIALVEVECKFVFVGSGPLLNDMKELSSKLGMVDRINFVGNVNPKFYLEKSQFAIHPSSTEGMSNAILEELAAGLPVIASVIPENWPLVTHEENGLLVATKSINELTNSITKLASNPLLRRQMGEKSREKSEEFSWPKSVEHHVTVLERLVREKRKKRNI
jgi:glycosyltransferase involved in cell wall biosynthesis